MIPSLNLVVSIGSEIQFVNSDIVAHTATSTDASPDNPSREEDGRFDTGLLKPKESKSIKFEESGDYFFCLVHPWMRGKVTVLSQEVPEFPIFPALVFGLNHVVDSLHDAK